MHATSFQVCVNKEQFNWTPDIQTSTEWMNKHQPNTRLLFSVAVRDICPPAKPSLHQFARKLMHVDNSKHVLYMCIYICRTQTDSLLQKGFSPGFRSAFRSASSAVRAVLVEPVGLIDCKRRQCFQQIGESGGRVQPDKKAPTIHKCSQRVLESIAKHNKPPQGNMLKGVESVCFTSSPPFGPLGGIIADHCRRR